MSIPPPRRILVINVSRIGDTLLVTPAIRAMAAYWPAAKIDVLGHPKRIEVLAHLPFIARIGGITKNTAWWRGRIPLSSKAYDLAVVYGFDEALVSYALRVSERVVAFRQKNDSINRKLTTVVDPPPFQSDHAVRLALALPQALGIPPAGYRLAYLVTEEESAWATQVLSDDIQGEASPLVGLQVASFPTKAYRDWPIQSFIALCQRIQQAWPKAHFLIFGGTLERERTTMLKDALGNAATLYAGRLSLRQTAALMSKLDLYIGVDTGPTHLMSTFDIPFVGLYHGFSRSELIAPLEHPCCWVIDHPRAGPDCPITASMADITVDQVWRAVVAALQK